MKGFGVKGKDWKSNEREPYSRGIAAVLVGAISINQATKVLFAVHTGWLPATLNFCMVFSPSPSFFPDRSGAGTKSAHKTVQFCQQNKAGDQGLLRQYKVASESFPVLEWGWVAFIAALVAVTIWIGARRWKARREKASLSEPEFSVAGDD